MRRRPLAVGCLILVFLLYLGTVFGTVSSSPYEEWEGDTVIITGSVYQKEKKVQTGEEQKILYLELSLVENEKSRIQVEISDKQNVICYLKAGQDFPEIGSIVKVKGRLKCFEAASNPGQFDAESYYRILRISFQLNQTEIQEKTTTYSKFREELYQIREKCSAILENTLPQKEALLMKTMLLGEKKALSEEMKELYQRNGIAHILAISGLHISLLGMTLYKLLKGAGLPIGIRCGIPLVIILFYVVMTGACVSSLRAVIMFGFQMAAQYFKRTYDLVTAACVAMLLLLLRQPLYVYHSGFLFSFGCVYAIGLFVPAMICSFEKKAEKALSTFLSGISLTAACLPLQLWYFYQIPLYSSFLNLLVIPLMSFLVPGGLLLIGVGSFTVMQNSFLLKALSGLITGILSIYEKSCNLLELLPFHLLIYGRPEKWQVFLYFCMLTMLVMLKKKLKLLPKWLILCCGILLLLWKVPGEMTITFLDVGQGDCIHIKSKEGNHYLVDGGSSTVSEVSKYRIVPYLKEQGAGRIEAVFVTHPDQDHCNGILELFNQEKGQGIAIGKLYLPDIGEGSRTESFKELEQAARNAGVEIIYLSKGQQLKEGELIIECLHPERAYESEEANQFSLVLSVTYGAFCALLTGDVEGEGEQMLIESLLERGIKDITVLKVAHHGSAYSTPSELLLQTSPFVAVISCGENNSYGHPHAELLERLRGQSVEIGITYESGAITFETDGRNLWAREFLQEKN